MAGQLLPPPGLAPSIPADAAPEDCIAMWADLVHACDEFLLAGLRREIGPDGDLQAAYRRWYARHREEHDQAILDMARRFTRPGGSNAS